VTGSYIQKGCWRMNAREEISLLIKSRYPL
jgi:hypothetical protein